MKAKVAFDNKEKRKTAMIDFIKKMFCNSEKTIKPMVFLVDENGVHHKCTVTWLCDKAYCTLHGFTGELLPLGKVDGGKFNVIAWKPITENMRKLFECDGNSIYGA